MDWLLDITLMECLTLIAICVGPLFGVYVARTLRESDNGRERRLRIFKTLMATRATTLSALHVESLNCIDLEFCHRKKDRDVREAWRLYLSHLGEQVSDSDSSRWNDKSRDLLADLLCKMAQSLGYEEFDKAHIKESAYYPRGHLREADEQMLGRHLLLDVLEGKRPLLISIIQPPVNSGGSAAPLGRP